MDTVVDGVIVRSPTALLPVQQVTLLSISAFVRVNRPLLGPPAEAFQMTRTLETVTAYVLGLVIVILMDCLPDAPGIRINPRVMFPHPVTSVGVAVAVAVDVAVAVFVGVKVAVGVLEGVSVGVLVGKGVNVTTDPEEVAVAFLGVGVAFLGVAVAFLGVAVAG